MADGLIPALLRAQANFDPIHKTLIGYHKNKYAPLDSVLESVLAHLQKEGILLLQPIQMGEMGPVLHTELIHISGERITSVYPLPATANSQEMGSAITYARRYALQAVLSLAPDEDDDGQKASGGSAPAPRKSRSTAPIRKDVDEAVDRAQGKAKPGSGETAAQILGRMWSDLEKRFRETPWMKDPLTKAFTPGAEAQLRVLDTVFGTDIIGGKNTYKDIRDLPAEVLKEHIKAKYENAVKLELEALVE